MLSSKELRRRLEVQGFTGLTDKDLSEVGPWMSFTPWLNTIFAAVGTFMGFLRGFPWILIALAFLMALGSVLPLHPFDWLYNNTIRFFARTRPLPQSGPRRRFVFSIGCWWLLLTAFLFSRGYAAARMNNYASAREYVLSAVVMGCLLTATSLLLAMSNRCVVSELLNWLSGGSAKRPAR